MHKIEDNLTQVKLTIQQAAEHAGRNPNEITLLAVSKTQSAQTIASAYAAGQRHFGENYLQEAIDKKADLHNLDICWHFIGPIQSNKTKTIAENFSWVHSIDREKIAQRLNDQRPNNLPPLNVCIQVNIDRETTKSGVFSENLTELAHSILHMPNLRLRGLMVIPEPKESSDQRDSFAKVRCLLDTLNSDSQTKHLLNKYLLEQNQLDTLSMGMSADLSEAIAEGATIVRIGTHIFGKRG